MFVSLLSGCSTRLADCTLMSTKNIYCKNVDLTKLEQKKCVKGKDIKFWGIGSNMKNAADKALESANGNLIIDPVIYYESVPLICGGYVVKGTVVNVPYVTNDASTSSDARNNRKIIGYRVHSVPGGKIEKTPVYEGEN